MLHFSLISKQTMLRICLVFLTVTMLILTWSKNVVSKLSSISQISVIEQPFSRANFTQYDDKILSDEVITASFISDINNMGIIAVRFDTFDRINDDVVTFAVREKGESDWFYQHDYLVDQFQPNGLFTFGFPVVPDSQGKNFEISIRSKFGEEGNSIGLSNVEPIFVTRHSYPLSLLKKDPRLIPYFIDKKIKYCNCQEIIFREMFSILTRIVIVTILAWFSLDPLILLNKRLQRSTFSLANFFKKLNSIRIDRICTVWYQKKADQFFLLEKNMAFPAFDGLRAWAIIMVFMTHTAAPLGDILEYEKASVFAREFYSFLRFFPFVGIMGGGMGVDLFFILSGFLMFMSLRKGKYKTLLSFMKKRYQRLLPAHIFFISPLLIGLGSVTIFLNIFFLVEFLPHFASANFLTWTMSYEMIFYLICGVWLINGRKYFFTKTWRFLILMSVFIYATGFFGPTILKYFDIKYMDMTRFSAFFFGVALAKIYYGEKKIWRLINNQSGWVGMIGIILITFFKYSWSTIVFGRKFDQLGIYLAYLVLDIGLFLLLAATISNKKNIFKTIFSHKLLRILGAVSYSFYLNHLFLGMKIGRGMQQALAFESRTLNMILYLLMSFAVSFILATFSFHFLEKPYFNRDAGK